MASGGYSGGHFFNYLFYSARICEIIVFKITGKAGYSNKKRRMVRGMFNTKKIAALISALVVSACIFVPSSRAQEFRGAPEAIRTPEQIVTWFSSDFQYQLKIPDRPQSPGETVELKSGDCDDFAVLASAILARSGIRSDVLIIKCRGLNIKHAICIWRDRDGTYDFISNSELNRTSRTDIVSAVAKFYPDWEEITSSNEKREYIETIASAR